MAKAAISIRSDFCDLLRACSVNIPHFQIWVQATILIIGIVTFIAADIKYAS
jgi:hypothetical protein